MYRTDKVLTRRRSNKCWYKLDYIKVTNIKGEVYEGCLKAINDNSISLNTEYEYVNIKLDEIKDIS